MKSWFKDSNGRAEFMMGPIPFHATRGPHSGAALIAVTTIDRDLLNLEGLHLLALELNERWRLALLHRCDDSCASVLAILRIGKPGSDLRIDPIGSADAA